MNIKDELLEAVENSGEKIVAFRIYVESTSKHEWMEEIDIKLTPDYTQCELDEALEMLNHNNHYDAELHGIILLTNNCWLEWQCCVGSGSWELKKTPTWDIISKIENPVRIGVCW